MLVFQTAVTVAIDSVNTNGLVVVYLCSSVIFYCYFGVYDILLIRCCTWFKLPSVLGCYDLLYMFWYLCGAAALSSIYCGTCIHMGLSLLLTWQRTAILVTF